MVLRIPDRDAFLDASLSVLRRYDLAPERVDRERGLIVTHRTTSAQWFEFWRLDSQGSYQQLESSLHTMGRTVTVNVDSVDEPASQPAIAAAAEPPTTMTASAPCYRVSVQVDKSRYSLPERQITTPSSALASYSERMPTTEGTRGKAARGHWVPLGRDALLEAVLLNKLVAVSPDVEIVD